MVLKREELDELINKHETGDVEKVDYGREIWLVVQYLVVTITFGNLFFVLFGALFSYIFHGDLYQTVSYVNSIAWIILAVTGIYMVASFYTGKAVFLAEMARRSWTNTPNKRSMNNVFEDMRSFLDPDKITGSLLVASVSSILFYLLLLPKII